MEIVPQGSVTISWMIQSFRQTVLWRPTHGLRSDQTGGLRLLRQFEPRKEGGRLAELVAIGEAAPNGVGQAEP